MPKDIVISCDGTGNEIGANISNVLKLFRVTEKNDRQRVYYHPGLGTIGLQNTWGRIKQEVRGLLGLAFGAGLDEDTLGAYRFLCRTWEPGDRVWMFGFSRGAYTVRVLAAFVHVMGLLPVDQLDLAGYAFSTYKKASADAQKPDGSFDAAPLKEAWHFSQVAGGRNIDIEFVGVWDTVASIIVPRQDNFLFDLQTLLFTRTNSSVKHFRQAISIDERRRMFRLNRWVQPQKYRSNPFDPSTEVEQDIRQVWFAGVHSDVGGGYREERSGPSKYPLIWMLAQAKAAGLQLDQPMIDHLAWGLPLPPHQRQYAPPSATAPLHDSLKGAWKILEWIPKSDRWKEWPARKSFLGFYLPMGEPRPIPEGALIHASVVERMEKDPSYRPINLPTIHEVEPMTPPPAAPAPTS
ncbi:DUF2235 domain-containing protein [Bradyrhizobium jicamae]|uniref:DUF2235 domain-containing protein n=1 Tax=Bradyrhizobium jicamae TaxID=280332 RepID=A0ABS5FBV9_9BRAD|nr:DUF2235 domain-containing protein [Bradyrhizobium jicamae]MBR0794271.1 DUF2235 domain-containing protein [Bradyrhizobium jicamae]